MTGKIVALHESAHACLSVDCGVGVESVSCIPDVDSGGRCLIHSDDVRANPEGNFILSAAGAVAVRMLMPETRGESVLADVLKASPSDFDCCMGAVVDHYDALGITPASYPDSRYCRLMLLKTEVRVHQRLADIVSLAGILEAKGEIDGRFAKLVVDRRARSWGRTWRASIDERTAKLKERFKKAGRRWPFPEGFEVR